jgi:hypothetical protein
VRLVVAAVSSVLAVAEGIPARGGVPLVAPVVCVSFAYGIIATVIVLARRRISKLISLPVVVVVAVVVVVPISPGDAVLAVPTLIGNIGVRLVSRLARGRLPLLRPSNIFSSYLSYLLPQYLETPLSARSAGGDVHRHPQLSRDILPWERVVVPVRSAVMACRRRVPAPLLFPLYIFHAPDALPQLST